MPKVGELAVYRAIYCPHWEIPHMRVRVGRARKLLIAAGLGMGLGAGWSLGFLDNFEMLLLGGCMLLCVCLPSYEWWAIRMLPAETPLLDEYCWVTFQGVVSGRGFYGHRGIMYRKVQIHRVLAHHAIR